MSLLHHIKKNQKIDVVFFFLFALFYFGVPHLEGWEAKRDKVYYSCVVMLLVLSLAKILYRSLLDDYQSFTRKHVKHMEKMYLDIIKKLTSEIVYPTMSEESKKELVTNMGVLFEEVEKIRKGDDSGS